MVRLYVDAPPPHFFHQRRRSVENRSHPAFDRVMDSFG